MGRPWVTHDECVTERQVGFPICFRQSSHVVADMEAPAAPPADGALPGAVETCGDSMTQ